MFKSLRESEEVTLCGASAGVTQVFTFGLRFRQPLQGYWLCQLSGRLPCGCFSGRFDQGDQVGHNSSLTAQCMQLHRIGLYNHLAVKVVATFPQQVHEIALMDSQGIKGSDVLLLNQVRRDDV